VCANQPHGKRCARRLRRDFVSGAGGFRRFPPTAGLAIQTCGFGRMHQMPVGAACSAKCAEPSRKAPCLLRPRFTPGRLPVTAPAARASRSVTEATHCRRAAVQPLAPSPGRPPLPLTDWDCRGARREPWRPVAPRWCAPTAWHVRNLRTSGLVSDAQSTRVTDAV
jgi:hypothetical protein